MASHQAVSGSSSSTSFFTACTAQAYDTAGPAYRIYADGESDRDLGFDGPHSYADAQLWGRIDAALMHLVGDGRRALRLLDAGCGPGTWLWRVVRRARALGFRDIEAYGLDASPAMIDMAKAGASEFAEPGVQVSFEKADLMAGLAFTDRFFDMTLCLYGVLNHLPASSHEDVAAELCRVTAGTLFLTVRTAGSLPTIYVDTLAHARHFRQDHDADWMDVDLEDGRHLGFTSHLFTNQGLRALFRPHLGELSMSGLDLFHSRFASHPGWNPPALCHEAAFEENLDRLERRYASDPQFIDRATHILLVGSC